MKILMVNKYLYPKGGAETYVFRLGKWLSEQGNTVEYFGMNDEKNIVGNSLNYYTKNMDFHTKKFSRVFYPFRIIYSKEAKKKFELLLASVQPEVVHLNNFNYQLTPSIIYAVKKYERETKRKVKIIFTAHDYQLLCPNHLMNNPITHKNCEACVKGKYSRCIKGKCIHGSRAKSIIGAIEGSLYNRLNTYRFIDTVICPSRFMANKMKLNPVFKNIVMLHNFEETIEWKKVQKKEYVLYFGRFSDEKGIRTLLSVCRELPEIPFVFAGSGPLTKEIETVPNVKCVGFLTGKKLEETIRCARFTIYPSEWYENCPFSVMESQMCGTPVIAADIGGIPELIQRGKTGELFESGNKEALKAEILELWTNREKNSLYSENCKNVHFNTLQQYGQKLISIYKG